MARLSKHCPTCNRKQPVTLEMAPTSPEIPTTVVAYRVTCRTCGTVIPSELADELVADGKAWVAANRDRVRVVAAHETRP